MLSVKVKIVDNSNNKSLSPGFKRSLGVNVYLYDLVRDNQ